MLLATTFDPAVLDSCLDEAHSACLMDHFRGIISCHVLIGQNGTRFIEEFQRRIEALPSCLQSRARNLFPELRDRLIMLDIPDDHAVCPTEYICAASRAAAILANCIDEIDAGIVNEDTKAAAELEAEANNTPISKLFTLPAFRQSHIADRERQLIQPTGRYTYEDLKFKIIKPLVYWAKHVKLIDKQLGKTVADGGGNLDYFESTIKLVYDTWREGYFARLGRHGHFELITIPPYEKNTLHPVTAQSVAEAIDPKHRQITFRVKSRAGRDDQYHCQHDRYISTNLDIAFGFSSGLDALIQGACGDGDVYLRHSPLSDEQDVIARWEEVDSNDDVFKWR